MYGSSDVKVNIVDVNSGAYLYLYTGAKAEGIMENGGCVEFERGAEVTFAANTFNGLEVSHSATVHSKTSAVDTTVNARGQFIVFDGGHATGLTVSNYGGLTVYSGAHLGGKMTFRDNAVVNVYSGAFVDFDISRLKPTNTAIVNDLAKIGTAPNFTLTVGGTYQTEGDYRLAEGATGFGKSITVLDDLGTELGTLTVNGDSLELDGMNYTLTLAGPTLTISAWKNVFSGDVTGETKNIFSGMSAVNVNVNERGILNISSGGVASSTKVNAGGSMNICYYGDASNTTVSKGVLNVKSEGCAYDTDIQFALANVSSGGMAYRTTVNQDGDLILHYGGRVAGTTINEGGYLEASCGGRAADTTVNKGGHLFIYSGGTATGRMNFADGAIVSAYEGAVINFSIGFSEDLGPFVNNLSAIQGKPTYRLTLNDVGQGGTYYLAEGAAGFDKTISVVDPEGTSRGTLTVGETVKIGSVDFTLNLGADSVLSVTIGEPSPGPGPEPQSEFIAKSDIDGNGISDVMFVWTGNNYAQGYWMNGQPDWQSQGARDMNGDGKADSVMMGETTIIDMKGTYVGYYSDGVDTNENWHTIGFLLDPGSDVKWDNKVGNLTGNKNMNSIVWYAPEMYALGVWKDGREDWAMLSGSFGGEAWTLVGCGDFDDDGKDSVLMSYNGGQMFYSVGLDGVEKSMGSLDWSGWEVRAIGDFAGDGKDDIVLFHKETGAMVMCADGNVDDYNAIGQLDAGDWFVVGAGDYNGDKKDDLLVRQYSTGMLGYYNSGDTAQWVELGRGVDMQWTVIA